MIQGSAVTHLAGLTADIVFLDPPYERAGEYEACFRVLTDTPPGIVIAQHATRTTLAATYGPFHRTRTLRQGENSLSFYSPSKSVADDAIRAEPQDTITPADGAPEEPPHPDSGAEPIA